MKLLIVSHACATPVNQQLYADVEKLTGWNLTLVVPSGWKTEYGRIVQTERLPGFNGELLALPVWKPGNIILHAYRQRFARLLRRINPDAIYVHHEPYAVASAQVCLANLSTIRRPMGFYSAQNIVKRYPPPFRWTESMVFRNSAFAFPVSSAVEDVCRTKGFKGESVVLPLGIDPSVYFPRADGPQIKAELRQSPGEVLIGYVGRLVPEKGLATLVKALALLDDLPWRLVTVGSGPFQPEFEAQAASAGMASRITHVGFVPHEKAPSYLSAIDMLVLPSETQANWKEQFGRVVIEAMACGSPVVGSDSGEIPNLIRATGGGVVFPERNPEQLAQSLRDLIVDASRRAALAEAGRNAVARHFALPALAELFASTIEKAVGRRTASPKSDAVVPPAALAADGSGTLA